MIIISYAEQVRLLKHLIPIGVKPICELVELLASWVDISEIALSSLPGRALPVALFNASHCILNDDLHLKENEMSLLAFQVAKNRRSSQYAADDPENEPIYVLFEEKTGYITSNCNQLFLDLELARGVSQHELDTEGNQFRSLIAHLAISRLGL